MNISTVRKEILSLNEERTALITDLIGYTDMLKGTLYKSGRTCGNPNCKCARGEKHMSWYLITNENKRTKNNYISAHLPDEVMVRVDRYHAYKKALERVREIDRQLSTLFNTHCEKSTVSLKKIKEKLKIKKQKS